MKKNIGPINAMYPSLITIVGAHVDDKPNFLTVAHVGIMNHAEPHYISVSLGRIHYTNQGIHANGQFSVNLPSVDLVAETDYVGMVSGKTTDKSKIFDVFYGELKAAPLIRSCPISMECRVHSVVDFPTHEVFVGEIVATHVDENALKDGKIDLTVAQPLIFDLASVGYYKMGDRVADAWSVGKQLKTKE